MTVSNTLNENWNLFIGESNAYVDKKFSYSTKGSILPLIYQNIGWIARNISLQSSKTSLSLIFSWYFPNRAWNGNKEFLGHFYTNLYNSSLDVNDQIQSTLLPNIINNVCKWHLLWANSLSLPELYPKTLLDTFLNGPQAYSRTGFHLKTSDWSNSGHWRQFEGFSCNQVEPPSMMGYRNFGLQLLFGKELNRNGILNMYNKGLNQTNNGIIGELYGGQCFGIGNTFIGFPIGAGNLYGDSNSDYIFNMYSQYLFYEDGIEYIKQNEKYIISAAEWISGQSYNSKYGLPFHLVNTFNEHGFIGDINSYNAILYICALSCIKSLNDKNIISFNNIDMYLNYAIGNLTTLLWTNNSFFRSYYCTNNVYPKYALQVDSLYGFVYMGLFDLIDRQPIPKQMILSHLNEENIRNFSPYGLQWITNRTTVSFDCNNNNPYTVPFNDRDTWESASINHAIASIFMNLYNNGTKYGLEYLKLITNKYINIYKDQWNYRDLSSTYNDTVGVDNISYSRPVCDDHYSTQLIIYASLWALNGQKWNGNSKTLIINPPSLHKLNINECLPILIPQMSSTLCVKNESKQCYEINIMFSQQRQLQFNDIIIFNDTFSNVTIYQNKTNVLCP
eukprot:262504_1